ncbi:MAG TPA: hypothetical protein VM368_05220, partial [Flavisolibacter sp.]|nr:hypothetical protein [Flavisolibacter sp.]
MKVVFVLFTLISVACNSVDSQTSKLIAPFTGTWKEISKERILGDPKVDEQYQEQFNNPNEFLSENTYSTFLLIKAKGDQLNVSFNVTDQPSID